MTDSARLSEALRHLPKAELHVHLEASIRSETALELAERYGLPLPDGGPFSDLTAFVPAYEQARDLLKSLDDVRRVAAELVEDSRAQGVLWSEVHIIPPTYGGRLGPEEGILEAVLDGFAGARTGSFGCPAAVIVGINRGLGLEAAERSCNLAVRYADRGVVGLGLAGDEANHPPDGFAQFFGRAREVGLVLVPHAGEGLGAESVRACIEVLNADRICHGVRAVEDPTVLRSLVDRRICLDLCPSSNVALQIVGDIRDHPLPNLFAAGVPLSLNSDGQFFSGSSILDEYRIAVEVFGFERADIVKIARTSFEFSGCPEPQRQKALTMIEGWFGESL